MKKILFPVLLFSTFAAAAAPEGASGSLTLAPDNIPEIVSALTLEEKVNLVIGYSAGVAEAAGDVGRNDRIVPGAAGLTFPVDRLGIPSIVLADGPAGLRIKPTREGESRTFYCTGFPVGTLLASTWDPELIRRVGQAMGNEVLEYGVDVLLAPGANLHRNPLCGRNFEYYSEDPVLAGESAAAFIQGVQSQGVGTSLKHFAINNQEINRLSNNAIVSEQVMRELYLKQFEIAVRKAQPWTVMTSYNFINGVHAAENKWLLTDILRGEWGFEGAVMTDWGGGYRGGEIIAAGNDMIQPGNPGWYNNVLAAVRDGSLSPEALDSSVTRILQLIVKTPTFRKYAHSDAPDLKAHAEVSRLAAEEGIILLKHKGALPLTTGSDVAVFGTASYEFIAGGTGSGDVNKPYVVDLRSGLAAAGFVMNKVTDEFYSDYMAVERTRCAAVNRIRGGKWFIDAERPLEVIPEDVISAAARSAQSAIITIGRIAGEGKDRSVEFSYRLSRDELGLIKAVSEAFHKAGKKITVLLDVCGVVDVTSWETLADDIVLCWLPGQEGGNAVADILSGKANPSGRLPMTFPRKYEDDPSSGNFPRIFADKPFNYSFYRSIGDGVVRHDIKDIDYTDYAEGLFMGYRHYVSRRVPVQYPFGYGLSYTGFSWSRMKVEPVEGGWKATVVVKNTGAVAGKDVVQIYLKAPRRCKDRPRRELKGFGKTSLLQSGQSEAVEIFIPASECAVALSERGSFKCGWRIVAAHNVNDSDSSIRIR